MKIFFLLLAVLCEASAQTVWFEPNLGQVAGPTQWIVQSGGISMYITADDVVYALAPKAPHNRPRDPLFTHNVHMQLIGGASDAQTEGLEPLGGYSNYFLGRTAKDWFTGIPHYARLRYRNVYPGIDVVYYVKGRDVEYDFEVAPGADPNQIELAFSEPPKLENGDIIVAGLRQRKPKVFQNGRELAARYRLTGSSRVQLALADYDREKALTVDPTLEFSTYLGGPGAEETIDAAFDSAGNIYVAGDTQAPASPALNPFQQTNIVSLAPFVMKFTADGQHLLYFTVLGAGGWDAAYALQVDAAGGVVVAGETESANFPLKNPVQSSFRAAWHTGFVTRLAPDGRTLVYSTYLGGSNEDTPHGVALDSAGNAFIAGTTSSNDFPTKNALQTVYAGGGDFFLSKFTQSGELLFSTYLGGSGADYCFGLTLDPQGNLIVVGGSNSTDFPLKNAIQSALTARTGYSTPLVVRISPDGGKLLYASFVGGPIAASASAVATDAPGNIYVAGYIDEPKLTVTKDAFQSAMQGSHDDFLLKFDPSGQQLLYGSYFGNGGVWLRSIAIDAGGDVFLGGAASLPDVPLTNSFQTFLGGGITNSDCYFAKLSPSLNILLYGTLLGGRAGEVCGASLDSSGNLYATGFTYSEDFPVKNAYQPNYAGGNDGILAKISDNTPPPSSPFTLSPGSLTFRYVQATALPQAQTVTVAGPTFSATASASWITTAATGDSILTVTVNPSGLAPGNYRGTIQIAPPLGTPATLAVTLTVLAPAPVLASVAPALVPVGSDDTMIAISGSGFTAQTTLQIDSVPWTLSPVVFVDSSTIQVTLPTAWFSAVFNHTIAVQNPQSALSNALSLSVGVPAPSFTAASVVNAGSFASGPVSPGEIVSIFGTNLTGNATFDNIPATLIYSSPTQINVTVPYPVTGSTTSLQIGSSVPVSLPVAPAAPGIFAAVANGDGTMTLYATGCGALTQDTLPRCRLPVSATLNGEPAQILYAGIAPTLVQGANQVNLMIPSGITSGQVTIVLTVDAASSRPFHYTLP